MEINHEERRRNYTWYFAQTDKEVEDTRAGVGVVIKNEFRNYIMDIEPISGRIMRINFNATLPITLLTVYAPTAQSTTDRKEAFYKQLIETYQQHQAANIVLTSGEFNAKVGRCGGPHKEHLLGYNTFQPESTNRIPRSES